MKIAAFLPLLLVVLTAPAHAEITKSSSQGLIRPLPGGIVFPSLYSSIEANPAGLLQEKKTVVAMEWQLPQPGVPARVSEGFAGGGKFFGMGGLLSASSVGNSLTLNRAALGVAVGMTGSSLGINVTYDVGATDAFDVDIGMAVENISGFQLSMLMTSIQRFQTIGAFNVGMGFSVPQKVQVEANWSYTLFSPEQAHRISTYTIFYSGAFGLGLQIGYNTSTLGASFVAGPMLSFAFSPRVFLSARGTYDTSAGTSATFAATLAF